MSTPSLDPIGKRASPRQQQKRLASLAAVLLFVPFLNDCAGLLAARSDDRYTVEMTDENRFLPGTVEIPAGSTVAWINRGRFVHTATADPTLATNPDYVVLPPGAPTWNSGNVPTGVQWAQTFTVPGTYVYFCQWHQDEEMLGSIIVTE
jgi:plastocyanin